jgi:hypothetical protein
MVAQHAIDPEPHAHFLGARLDMDVTRPQRDRVKDNLAAQPNGGSGLRIRQRIGRVESGPGRPLPLTRPLKMSPLRHARVGRRVMLVDTSQDL